MTDKVMCPVCDSEDCEYPGYRCMTCGETFAVIPNVPQWLDKPDSEGYWLRINSLGKIQFDYFSKEEVETWEFSGTGKWSKAIIPELPKEAQHE